MEKESFSDKSKTFYFTFGVDSQLGQRYVKIHAPSEIAARYVMVQHFGYRWSSFYDEVEWRRNQYSPTYSLLVVLEANEQHDKIASETVIW